MIKFDQSATDVKYSYGLDPEDFIAIHEHLSSNYNLIVSKIRYFGGEYTFKKLGNKMGTQVDVSQDIVYFEILYEFYIVNCRSSEEKLQSLQQDRISLMVL